MRKIMRMILQMLRMRCCSVQRAWLKTQNQQRCCLGPKLPLPAQIIRILTGLAKHRTVPMTIYCISCDEHGYETTEANGCFLGIFGQLNEQFSVGSGSNWSNAFDDVYYAEFNVDIIGGTGQPRRHREPEEPDMMYLT